MDDYPNITPSPQDMISGVKIKKSAKRSLTSKNFKFGNAAKGVSSKSIISDAKQIMADQNLNKVIEHDKDDSLSQDSISKDSSDEDDKEKIKEQFEEMKSLDE